MHVNEFPDQNGTNVKKLKNIISSITQSLFPKFTSAPLILVTGTRSMVYEKSIEPEEMFTGSCHIQQEI
jgi:hypothetical protein